ncbi:MAG: SUMF1/EgtB/PvdO family nonheme iron enzyme [Nitrospiraceae bacterium]
MTSARLFVLLGGLVLLQAQFGAAEPSALPSERPSGSGAIVHSDGYILTAYHVVAGARRIVVVTPGEFRAPALIVSSDQEHDLALLKIDTVGLSEAALGYAGSVRLDQEVITIGFPFGLKDISVTRGRIAAMRTKGVRRVFQVDAAINPGNSGGPVFNRRGEIIGILTTKFSHPSGIIPEGMSFAVPLSYATPLLANIPEFDFSAIGKTRRETKADDKNGDLVRELARVTVRIETVRSDPPSPGAGTSARAKAEEAGTSSRPPRASNDRPARESNPGPSASREREPSAPVQQTEIQRPRARDVVAHEDLLLIPEGEFLMGSDDGLPDARPVHAVHLSAYRIDKYEVTNARYRRCVEAGVCQPPKVRAPFEDQALGQYPVTSVTWMQARTFCQWAGQRLPTEAEWEKAARGVDGRRYAWGNDRDPILSRGKNGENQTNHGEPQPVGSFQEGASPYGALDLTGNVWEWVKDWYAEDFYAVAPPRDPQGPPRGSFRVLRGGDWGQGPLELQTSYRGWDEMTYWGPTLGFRCAADAP